jgi:ribosome maturation factor RimP
MSQQSTSHLNNIIAPAVTMLGYEFIACELVPQGGQVLLKVYVNSDTGITVRDCEIVSRQISALLDVEDPVAGKYDLEVSSPGADRLLVTGEHYRRFVGRSIKVKLRQSRNGRRNYKGLLQSVSDGNIVVVVDGDTFVLPISEIERANLVPDF